MTKTHKQTLAIIILALLLCLAGNGFSQNATQDPSGNYHAISAKQIDSAKAVNTGKTYTDAKGTAYPVFQTVKGKLFIRRVSKTTGREYAMYLKL